MHKIIKTLLSTGAVFAIQPAVAIPSNPEIVDTEISQAPNQMMQLAETWGFTLADCQGNVAVIRHDVTGEQACVAPTSELKAGEFIYDSANNRIYSETTQETSNSDTDLATREAPTQEIVFDFTNSYDYSTCLDNILLAYENRQVELQHSAKNECAYNILNTFGNRLSEDTALELITAANTYATQDLDIQLYPPFGLRRRVAINFGYVYEIDRNNEDILKYVSSNQ